MFRKLYFSFIVVGLLVVLGNIPASAQFSPVTGVVELQKADNTREPVPGAVIDVYRLDIKAGLPSSKTGKKGEFSFAGLPVATPLVFAVSAPNCAPTYVADVKAGQERLVITMYPGDGSKMTEEAVRKAVAGGTKPGDGTTAPSSGEQKKQDAEIAKKNAEITAKNEKIKQSGEVIKKANSEGAAAFLAKNFDLAIAKFDEGYQADPDYEGSAPIFLTNKGLALRERGVAAYRAATGTDDATKAAAMVKTTADLEAAAASFQKALDILAKAPAGADAKTQGELALSKLNALSGYVVAESVMVKLRIASANPDDAIGLLDQYLAAETDEPRRLSILNVWSNNMRDAGNMKNSIYGYRKLIEKAPDNVDAMAGLGLSLFNDGVSSSPENKEEMQEGLNLMQKFADTAPDTHPLKASVKDAVDYLKNTAKLAPQKLPPTPKKKP